jgi:hypothetical protein
MSGGFTPGLQRTSEEWAREPAFIASEHMMKKRGGITVDATTVGADADGDKVLSAGTVMALVDSTGKYRAYDNGENADAGGTAAGFLLESINLKDGDVICGIMLHGSVLAARTSGLDSNARTDLAGRIVFQ